MQPNPKYGSPASEASIARVTEALTQAGITVFTVADGAAALQKVRELIPEGAEVMTMTSQTLVATGILKDIEESGRYDVAKKKLAAMDQTTQAREKRQIGAAPDWAIGSVHAVTEDGYVLIASATGSQLPAYAYGAGKAVWVVGTQKIVQNLEEGMKRIHEYSFVLENERAKVAYGVGSFVSKILMIHKEYAPGRLHMILVKENLGF